MTACSPEKFDGPDQNGIPSISGKDIQISVDQAVNQATFTVSGMEKGTYPIWIIDGKSYSTLDPTSYSNAKAGTHDIELRLGNRNGFSQGSISKSFKFDNSIVDFSAYVNRIARTWRINYAESGHMGCGQPGSDGSNWWSAEPNVKADWGVYDDRITFTADGAYTFDPGDGGTVYVNTGASIFAEYNTNDGQDFMAPVETQNTTYKFDVEGEKILLKLPAQTLFPYLSSDDQYNNPVFTVSKLTNSEMLLLYEGEGITWRFLFTSKEDTDAPFTGFKANSDFNMWKKATFTNDFYYAHGDSWEQNPQPIGFETVSENNYKITLPCESNMQWQAQVKFFTDMSSTAANNYDFSAILTSTNDIKGVTVKLVLHGGGDNDNVYYFADRIDLDAGDSYVFWKSDMPGIDMDKVDLVLDFGGAPAGTEVEVKNVVFKNHADDDGTVLPDPNGGGGGDTELVVAPFDFNDAGNMLKNATWEIFRYYAHGDSWEGYNVEEMTYTNEGNQKFVVTLPYESNQRWQAQFQLQNLGGVSTQAGKTYDFSIKLKANQDLNSATVKLTDAADDTNFYFDEIIALEGDTEYALVKSGMEGKDISLFHLVFDFGGCQAGTVVEITDMVFKEHSVDGGGIPGAGPGKLDYNDAANLWKAVDDGSMFDSYFYYMADNNWMGISYQEVNHNGDAYELTLPEGLGGSQWQGQFAICTKLTASAEKKYDFQVEIESDYDLPQVTIKLTDAGDTNFFCQDRHDIPGGDTFVYTLKGASLAEGTDASAIRLFFDFGGSPAGANVKISKIVFKEAQ